MPITQINLNDPPAITINPLSRFWTHERVASEVMVLTNVLNSQYVQLENIRYHINMQIGYLAELLNLANHPFYSLYLGAILERISAHSTGLDWVNIDTPQIHINSDPMWCSPIQMIDNIKRISIYPIPGGRTTWKGNCTKRDISVLTQQMNNMNDQERFTVSWAHEGNGIFILAGSEINTQLRPSNNYYSIKDTITNIHIFANRRPLLDSMVPPNIAATLGNNYSTMDEFGGVSMYAFVDLPDQYISLLVKLVQKNVLEQLNAQIPPQMEQEINASIARISQVGEIEQEKMKYVHPTSTGVQNVQS